MKSKKLHTSFTNQPLVTTRQHIGTDERGTRKKKERGRVRNGGMNVYDFR